MKKKRVLKKWVKNLLGDAIFCGTIYGMFRLYGWLLEIMTNEMLLIMGISLFAFLLIGTMRGDI